MEQKKEKNAEKWVTAEHEIRSCGGKKLTKTAPWSDQLREEQGTVSLESLYKQREVRTCKKKKGKEKRGRREEKKRQIQKKRANTHTTKTQREQKREAQTERAT